MNPDRLRAELVERQREAIRCSRLRLDLGEDADEERLAELDAELFSIEQTRRVAQAYLAARSSGDSIRSSARSILAICLEWGARSRLRALDRALATARRSGHLEPALELAAERRRAIAAEGARKLLPAQGVDDALAPGSAGDLLFLAGHVRGADFALLLEEARSILDRSAPLVETERESAQRAAREDAPLTFEGRVERLLLGAPSPGLDIAAELAAPAIRELGEDLGLDAKGSLRIVPAGHPLSAPGPLDPLEAPVVLEEDPPARVSLYLSPRNGSIGLAHALGAGARALAALVRSPHAPVEHRLHHDGALSLAMSALLASLASEHRALLPVRELERSRSLFREVLEARLSASLFIDRHTLLASGESRGEAHAIEEAALRPPAFPDLPLRDEAILDSADRFRGYLLMAPLRDRMRTRFGNLWYRDRAAGRAIQEILEPGGAVVGAEIVSGLSLAEPSAENLLQSWKEERRRIR